MAKRDLPSIAELRNLIRYNPDTGEAHWHYLSKASDAVKDPHAWNKQKAGRPAGTYTGSNGYVQIEVLGCKSLVHRVVWALHYGVWPTDQIDHVNGDRSDNRIENLRDVSHEENMRNRARPKNNTTGHVGVYRHAYGGVYYAQITVKRKTKYLGRFSDLADAVAARKAAERKYGFSERHGS